SNTNTILPQPPIKFPSAQFFPSPDINYTSPLPSSPLTTTITDPVPELQKTPAPVISTTTTTSSSTLIPESQPTLKLPENVCAMCFSTTVPDNVIPINGTPCSKEYTVKCS